MCLYLKLIIFKQIFISLNLKQAINMYLRLTMTFWLSNENFNVKKSTNI